jgi:hypothetical protein
MNQALVLTACDTIEAACRELLTEGRGPVNRQRKLIPARAAAQNALEEVRNEGLFWVAKRFEEAIDGIDTMLTHAEAQGIRRIRDSNLGYIRSQAQSAASRVRFPRD